MPKSFKSIILIILLLLGVSPLYGNLPCEDGCENKCECEKGQSSTGSGSGDGGAGNDGSTGGTGGTDNGSVSIWVNWGSPVNENVSGEYRFSIYSKKPSPLMYSPQIIQYRNIFFDRINIVEINQSYKTSVRGDKYANEEDTYYDDEKVVGIISNGGGQEKLVANLPSDVTHQVKLMTSDRQMLTFQFKNGSSIGTMTGETSTMNNVMVMVNASGEAVTSNPVYYDRYFGYGNFARYSAETGVVVSYHTAMGRVIPSNAPTVGVEPIYDSEGIIRQVWSRGDGLADVVVTEAGVSYEIRCYAPDKVGSKSNGVYTVNGEPHTVWRVENPNPGTNTRVKVTKTVNGVSEVSLFEYSHNAEGWSLKKPGDLALESQTTSWDYSGTVKVITTVEKSPDGKVASKVARTYQKYGFGDRIVNVSRDPDGANLRSQSTYYTSSNETGSYGRIKTESSYTGYWSSYQYDAKGRETVKITPWKNSAFNSPASSARAEYLSYAPVDSRDVVADEDSRPRTEETKILGITTSKTYHAYYFDGNIYTEVEERCVNNNAAYGDPGNLRTERRYYPKGDASSPSAGRIHTVKYPNGTMDTYTYEYGNWSANADPGQSSFTAGNGWAIRENITHGTVDNPSGIAGKTTRDSKIYDERGSLVYTTQSVYTGSGYEQFAWMSTEYDEFRRQIAVRKSNNELTEYTWNCCAKASETLPDGTQYTYVYDDLKRLVAKTKVGIGNQPDLVTTYEYDAADRRIKETITGGDLSTTATWEYNLAGQLVKSVDHQGLVTTYSYTIGSNSGSNRKGQTSTTVKPGGFTVISDTFCDGQIASLTGTAQIPQYFDYGVNSDGSNWVKSHIAGSDSAKWEKTTTGLIGQIIQSEKSGFNGTVVQHNTYNIKGQLVKTTQTGSAPILYEYDALGNVFRQGLDVDNSGTLDLAGNDQISETETNLTSTWATTTQKVYGKSGSNAATVVSVQKRRVSGFSNNLTAESQSTDIYGNTTVQTQTVDRNAKTVTVNQLSPASTVSQQIITVNGLKVSQRSETNLTTTFGYDGLGRMISATDPRIGKTTVTYHTEAGKKGLEASVTDPAGNSTTYDYDSTTGRLLWEKNALNQYTRYAYNDHGQVTNVWGDVQYPIQFGYDQFGQKTTMRTFRENAAWNGMVWPANVSGDLTTWTYDAASGLVTSKTDAKGKSVNYTYTVDGKLASRTWARGIVTNYTYDSATGKLLKADYSDTTPDITYTYNRSGQIATIQDAAGSRTFTYDDTFNQIKETISGIYSKDLNKSYTATGMKGQIQGFAIGDVQNYTYTYDDYGRINKITTPMGDFNYTRLLNSDLISQMTRPNGVASSWSYEDKRNLLAQVQNGSVSDFGYTNNAIGNRTAMSRAGSAFAAPDTISYSYNSRSEVIGAVSNQNSAYNYAYSFDPIGNRLTANLAGTSYNYTTNMLNQYTVVNSNQPTYDDDGNMLTNGSWSYTWNGENRMVQAVNGNTKLQFVYDYMGRRVEKKVFVGDTVVSYKRFVYDNYKQVEELDALNSNSLLKCYSWQPEAVGLDVPLSMTDVATAKNYAYTLDANKNVSDLTDAQGNVVAHYEYSPFGTHVATGSYTGNPFRFSSEVFDSETGLIYYNYRYYNPSLGRWINRDPIEEEGGWNLYGFVKNIPIKLHDLHGLVDCCGHKEYNKNSQCCINNKIENKISDDAGEKCCSNEIEMIEIRNERGNLFNGGITPGHSFVAFVNKRGETTEAWGFYPKNKLKAPFAHRGEVRNDLESKYDIKLTYHYRACPNSVQKLREIINRSKIKPPYYQLTNIIGNNCSGMACKWVEQANFQAPFDPDTPFLAPVQGDGEKGYGAGRRITH